MRDAILGTKPTFSSHSRLQDPKLQKNFASSPASIISDIIISGAYHLGRHYLRRRSSRTSLSPASIISSISSPAPLISIAIITILTVSAFTP
ncbi:hypothetical protein YC2023_037631 [Brassica napus]